MHTRRGNALPETMIVATFMMMMMFGTLNLALLGYNQVQADGAAFVGSRTASLASQTNPGSVSSTTTTTISSIFPHVQPSAVLVGTGGTNLVSSAASISMTSPSLPFLSGSSGPLKVLSHDVEPTTLSSPPPTEINFQITSAQLKNYIDWTSKAGNPAHQAHLASSLQLWCNDPLLQQGAPCDQGVLAVAEACGHDAVYDQLAAGKTYGFPTSGTSGRTARATALAELNNFSPTNSATPEYQIAQWDAGNSPSWTNACGGVNWYPSPLGT